MLQEFKNFIMKGNVLELAVAVIMAGAFGAIVKSFTSDILMPPIGLALGGVDFEDMKHVLKAAQGETPEVAIMYGRFIKFIVDFLIISFILFILIRAYNKTQKPKEEAPAPPPGPSETDLLIEIRDLLKKQ